MWYSTEYGDMKQIYATPTAQRCYLPKNDNEYPWSIRNPLLMPYCNDFLRHHLYTLHFQELKMCTEILK